MEMNRALLWFCAAVLLAGVARAGEESVAVAPAVAAGGGAGAKYVYLEVKGELRECRPPIYLLDTGETLGSLLGRIERARDDDSVRGLIVRVGAFGGGWAKVQEVRAAIRSCADAGKDTICILDGADNRAYCLATGADRIVLTPMGQLMLSGLRAEALFARELLDKLGIRADFIQAGRYKGAAEPLTRQNASSAFRESLESVLEDYYGQMLGAIAQGRGVPVSQAEVMVRRGPYTAVQAVEAGLADDVMFYDQLLSQLRDKHGSKLLVDKDYGLPSRPGAGSSSTTSLFSLLMGTSVARRTSPRGAAIAVLYAVGPIIAGEEGLGLGEQTISLDTFVKTLREAVSDRNVKAIVLRVDSPGGSALVCDTLWRELRLADAKKPVITSFSDTAASGGYYLGVAGRKIFAEPGTLTGSIGVVGGKLVLSELLNKVGVNVVVIQRGSGSGFASSFQGFNQQERKKLEELIQDTYRIFLRRVAETRTELSPAALERVAQGRVWTGAQAYENGLVDELGGVNDAIQAAKEAAGLAPDAPVRILHLPRSRSIVEYMLFGPGAATRVPSPWGVGVLPAPLAEAKGYISALLSLRGELTLCLMPAMVSFR